MFEFCIAVECKKRPPPSSDILYFCQSMFIGNSAKIEMPAWGSPKESYCVRGKLPRCRIAPIQILIQRLINVIVTQILWRLYSDRLRLISFAPFIHASSCTTKEQAEYQKRQILFLPRKTEKIAAAKVKDDGRWPCPMTSPIVALLVKVMENGQAGLGLADGPFSKKWG